MSSVISYLVQAPPIQGEYVNDMPYDFRQHEVPNARNRKEVFNLIMKDRGSIPYGSYMYWYSGSVA